MAKLNLSKENEDKNAFCFNFIRLTHFFVTKDGVDCWLLMRTYKGNSIYVPNSYYGKKQNKFLSTTNYNSSKHKQQAIDMQRMVTIQNTQMN